MLALLGAHHILLVSRIRVCCRPSDQLPAGRKPEFMKMARITTIQITQVHTNNTTQLSTEITLTLKHRLANKLKP